MYCVSSVFGTAAKRKSSTWKIYVKENNRTKCFNRNAFLFFLLINTFLLFSDSDFITLSLLTQGAGFTWLVGNMV